MNEELKTASKENPGEVEDAKIHSFDISPNEDGTPIIQDSQTVGLNGIVISPSAGLKTRVEVDVDGVSKIKFFLRATSPDGFPYFTAYSDLIERPADGRIRCEADIAHLMLMPGEYSLWFGVSSDEGEKRILTERYVPFVVKSEQEVDARYSFFWNTADWSVSAPSEYDSA
jgi:hypothetical protein